jgi:hypothetical protein
MCPLKSHFCDDALTTLEIVLKQTKEARVFRRAQAVRAVVGTEPGPDPTPGKPQTPGLAALSLLEPPHQRGAAQCHRRRPIWDLQSLL